MQCLSPKSLATVSIPDRPGSARSLAFFASWPSDPGAYELTRHIGDGSSASVYQAHCKQLQATVAVKKLDLDGRGCDLGALIREAALLRRFQHRHVLLLYTSFVVGRELWMVMPYMDLGSVRSIMRKTWPQGIDEVLIATIMHSTLEALQYVHRNGGIHRDIKADNILVNSNGEVRLADFGVAADNLSSMSFVLDRMLGNSSSDDGAPGSSGGVTASSNSASSSSSSSSSSSDASSHGGSSHSSSGASCDSEEGRCGQQAGSVKALRRSLLALRANTFVGTPCWMAPEVMQQLDEGYSNAADIWSVGITLIELATGRPPLARCHPLRVLSDTMHCPPPSLPTDSSNRRFSKALRDLVATCLQKDPSKRPTAAELLQHRFFKAAKGPAYLSETLLAALLQQPQQPAGSDTPAQRAASIPARLPSGALGGLGSFSANSRNVHSEPLMARLRSVLGLAPTASAGAGAGARAAAAAGLGSFLGPRASRMGLAAASKSGAGAGGLKGGSSTAAGGLSGAAAAAGSLSRSGSRGVKVSLPPSEAARCSFYSK